MNQTKLRNKYNYDEFKKNESTNTAKVSHIFDRNIKQKRRNTSAFPSIADGLISIQNIEKFYLSVPTFPISTF